MMMEEGCEIEKKKKKKKKKKPTRARPLGSPARSLPVLSFDVDGIGTAVERENKGKDQEGRLAFSTLTGGGDEARG